MKMYEMVRTDEEIDDLIIECMRKANDGRSKYPGMTYEQGIRAAIEWLVDHAEQHPLA